MPSDLSVVTAVDIKMRVSTGKLGDFVHWNYAQIVGSDETTALTSTISMSAANGVFTPTTYTFTPTTIHVTDKTSWDGARLKFRTGTGTSSNAKLYATEVVITYTASSGTTYTEIGSGGATVGSSAPVFLITSKTASGGTLGGGIGLVQFIGTLTGVGGVLCGGTSDNTLIKVVFPTGGSLAGGSSLVLGIYNLNGTGGSLAGGASTCSVITSRNTSGGAICGGVSLISKISFETSLNGVLCGGTSISYVAVSASGGVVGGGSSTLSKLSNLTASGGGLVGGVATLYKSSSLSASGGANGGGLPFVQKITGVVASGGSLVSGTSIFGRTYFNVASGGIVCGGLVVPQYAISISIGGGIVGGGLARHTERYNSLILTGGAEGAGVSIISLNYRNFNASGGATCNGTYSRSTLVNDLISHWRLDETSGTRIDSHSDNDFLPTNTPGYASGKLGDAAQFVSLDNQALVVENNDRIYLGETDFTIACWVKFDDFNNADSNDFVGFVGKGQSNLPGLNNYTFGLIYRPSIERFQFSFADNNSVSSSVTAFGIGAIVPGTWYCVIASYETSTDRATIFVNGYDDFANSPIHIYDAGETYDFSVGRGFNRDRYNFNGLVDSVSLWRRLLTDDEKLQLYNSGSGFDYLWDSVINIETGSGGAECSGTASVQKFNISTVSGSGGALGGGVGVSPQTIIGTGGAVGGGKAIRTLNQTGTGGAVGGGIALKTTTYAPGITGGALGGGLALRSYLGLNGLIGYGGAVCGGLSLATINSANRASGGGLIGGSVFNREFIISTGGAFVCPKSSSPSSYVLTNNGGVELSGHAADEQCIANHTTSDSGTGTGSNNSSLSGVVPTYVFNSPEKVATSDNIHASAIMTTDGSTAGWLVCNNFGLFVPNGSTINSITFTIERSASVTNRIKDSEIRIIKNGSVVGDNKANLATYWTTSDLVRTYGGDLWGTTWTKDDIQDPSFGLAIKISKTNGGTVAAMVDQVVATVAFTGGFTNCTINIISSGGIMVGGEVSDDPSTGGGVIPSGEAIITGGKSVIVPQGGVNCSGVSTALMTFNTPSYNGGVYGGLAGSSTTVVEPLFYHFVTGGITVSPKNYQVHSLNGIGGARLGGVSERSQFFLSHGGVVLGSTNIVSFVYTLVPTGGVKFGSKCYACVNGDCAYDERGFGGSTYSGLGSVYKLVSPNIRAGVLNSTSSVTFTFIVVIIPEGGSEAAGTANILETVNLRASGGIRIGGKAQMTENFTSTDGIVIRGSATSNIVYKLSRLPVDTFGGGTSLVKETITLISKPGVLIGETSLNYRLVQHVSSGGSLCSGRGHQTYNQISSGGCTIGGVSTYTNPRNIIASGGVTVSPNSTKTSVWHISGAGGSTCSGRARIIIIKDVNTILFKRIGILLKSTNVLNFEELYQKLIQIRDEETPESEEIIENAGWCESEARCDEGILPVITEINQDLYLPDNKIVI